MTMYTAQRKLGELIVALRKLRNMGVKKLAQQSRVSKKTIVDMANGAGTFAVSTVKRIVKVLGVTDAHTLSKIEECLRVIHPSRLGPVFRVALV